MGLVEVDQADLPHRSVRQGGVPGGPVDQVLEVVARAVGAEERTAICVRRPGEVPSQSLDTWWEPAGGLEPPTPCLQDIVHAPPFGGLTCADTNGAQSPGVFMRSTCDTGVHCWPLLTAPRACTLLPSGLGQVDLGAPELAACEPAKVDAHQSANHLGDHIAAQVKTRPRPGRGPHRTLPDSLT